MAMSGIRVEKLEFYRYKHRGVLELKMVFRKFGWLVGWLVGNER